MCLHPQSLTGVPQYSIPLLQASTRGPEQLRTVLRATPLTAASSVVPDLNRDLGVGARLPVPDSYSRGDTALTLRSSDSPREKEIICIKCDLFASKKKITYLTWFPKLHAFSKLFFQTPQVVIFNYKRTKTRNVNHKFMIFWIPF